MRVANLKLVTVVEFSLHVHCIPGHAGNGSKTRTGKKKKQSNKQTNKATNQTKTKDN